MQHFLKKYNISVGFVTSLILGTITGVPIFDTSSKITWLLVVEQFMLGIGVSCGLWYVNFKLFNFTPISKTSNRDRMVISFLLSICIGVALTWLMDNYLFEHNPIISTLSISSDKLLIWNIFRLIMVNSFTVIMKYYSDLQSNKEAILVENERLKSENSLAIFEALTQLMNPHFLFNSLNSLQALIVINSPNSIEFIVRLSQVYRYLLQHAQKSTVTLSEELAFIDAYYYLLQTRFENNFFMVYDIPDSVKNKPIPPVSLQLLIENAVKHNVVSPQKPLTIRISATSDEIIVSNNLQLRKKPEPSSKFGLESINNRYFMLMKKHISVEQTADTFTVRLPI